VPEVTIPEPAIDGWFAAGETGNPHLIGSKCPKTGTYLFPPRDKHCHNPE
jgi:uncharacterized OB-fold protein